MSKKKPALTKLQLTEHALEELAAIKAYSIDHWGRRVATKYLKEIETRLQMVQEKPHMLASMEGLPASLQYYLAGSHVLIFDARPGSLVLLTVIHGSRDIPSRLSDLAPTLALEVEALHGKLKG